MINNGGNITMHSHTEIKTERLYLRTITEDDVMLVRSFKDDEFKTDEAALAWIHKMTNRNDTCFIFYIWLTQTNEFIGRVYFGNKAEIDGEVEIGYGIHEAYRCKNYATEAAKAVVKFAFEQAGQERLSAIVHSENVASRRVIEKLGFTSYGVRMVFDNGKDCEFDYFKLYRK